MASIIQPLTLPSPRRLLPPRHRSYTIRCCKKMTKDTRNYYELLGVSEDSGTKEIKAAYRKLQKKHHPDIAGEKAHDYVLRLNEAYGVLMSENSRREYDAGFERSNGVSYCSSWNGPVTPEALFVDENACIGCRECVHHACGTFMMDEALGSARVKVQFGDDEQKIQVAVESCPANCIHWVDREELSVLEFLIQPQPKSGHGVFGQGWERPKNVFAAAKDFKKQMKAKSENHRGKESVEEETPAQAEAQIYASMEMAKIGRFSWIWDWLLRDDDTL